MSSFGTAIVIDVPDDTSRDRAEALLRSPAITTDGIAPRSSVYATEAPDGWRRLTAYVEQPGLLDELPLVLPPLGNARVAVAEDFDEWGAVWAVLALEDGALRTIHRRFVLNADPTDPQDVAAAIEASGEDPRSRDLAGDGPAAEAAALFGVDPAAVVAAEQGSASAHERIGIVGGPFPWWDALALPWPQDGAGALLGPSDTDTAPATSPTPAAAAPTDADAAPRRKWWRRGGAG